MRVAAQHAQLRRGAKVERGRHMGSMRSVWRSMKRMRRSVRRSVRA